MNLSETIHWATKMINSFECLNPEEKKVFSFIKSHQSIIKELEEVFQDVNPILQLLKNEGMSEKSANTCLSMLKVLESSPNQRISKLANLIKTYINLSFG